MTKENLESHQLSEADEIMKSLVGSQESFLQPESLVNYVKNRGLSRDVQEEVKRRLIGVLNDLKGKLESL
ncbi:MAG: hypothetical protein A2915_00725 [Candidatus Yanofskybacteria bacterium RIFCSPLOWO2_01_FULL_41_34]|uniref:Uncharacterized protein n=1 Tax=Candidatus Yanofskybacteria bacterium RIFCSPHIGHO2_01_FULL_41_26 TaxID=1802661 RepID=A0A1F8EC26_9BACT|nr:MAG: hypothetical protein A2649_02755 [Candidatus Yanofskybacteria bacterium RIFCSPHIGHO2_01_FULL_41_26]OGN22419.1 MAG: hypothetical protein A2915_00725 [Candidatus Yanofskybacteria bacterium RIFCSPLOWO2_01_FULL_41_34]